MVLGATLPRRTSEPSDSKTISESYIELRKIFQKTSVLPKKPGEQIIIAWASERPPSDI